MQTAFWIVLIVGGALTLTRLPAITQSTNAALTICGATLVTAFGLLLPPIYAAVDGNFVRTNFTDLLAKLCLFIATNILCDQLARVLNAPRALSLISGVRGRAVFAIAYAAELVAFAFTDTPAASPGLELYLHQPAVLIYNIIAVGYIAYLAAVLIRPLRRDATTTRNRWRRTASGLILVGFALAIIRALLMLLALLDGLYEFGQTVSALSALFVIAGLTAAWVALRKQPGTPPPGKLLRMDDE